METPRIDPARLPELYEAVCQLHSSLELNEVIDRALRAAIKLTNAEHAFIKLRDRRVVHAVPALAPDNMPVTTSIMILTDDVAQSRQSRLIANGRDDPRFPAELLSTVFADRTILTVPLQIQQEFLGALVVDRPVTAGAFVPEDMAVLDHFAASAILAIKSALATQESHELTSALIHVLRNPALTIMGYADLMLIEGLGPLNDQQKGAMVTVHSRAYRMGRLLDERLDDMKITYGRFKLNISEIDLKTCIEDLLAERPLNDFVRAIIEAGVKPEDTSVGIAYLARAKQQIITLNVPDLPSVRADHNELTNIITEWLEDTIKSAEKGGEIDISAEIQGPGVKVSIHDQRLRSGGSIHHATHIVELMGGTIGFESEPGKGSTFWFTLPIAEPQSSPNF